MVELPQREISTVNELIDSLVDGINYIISEQISGLVVNTVCSIGLMTLTNWKLVIAMLVIGFPIGMALIKTGRAFGPVTEERTESKKELRGHIERLNFFTTIRSFVREKYEMDGIHLPHP